jgi:hypothetical protein
MEDGTMSTPRAKSAKHQCGIVSPDPAQLVIDGVRPVSIGERLSWQAQQPMQPKRQQRPLDIGFWNPMRSA